MHSRVICRLITCGSLDVSVDEKGPTVLLSKLQDDSSNQKPRRAQRLTVVMRPQVIPIDNLVCVPPVYMVYPIAYLELGRIKNRLCDPHEVVLAQSLNWNLV